MAGWGADLHLELSRLHHEEILRRAREEQLLSLASGGHRNLLGRARAFLVAHRPRRAAPPVQADAGNSASALRTYVLAPTER